MIGRLEGPVHHLTPGELVVDVGGAGYLVHTTLRAYQELASACRAVLWIHTHVRSEAIQLFGFPERDELEAFERLIAIAGVGPRIALAVLSGLTPGELAAAVEDGDATRLQRTPGVGRKTAERIVLELKGRFTVEASMHGDQRGDALSALTNLGYPQRDAERVVDQVLTENRDRDLAELLRAALQRLTR